MPIWVNILLRPAIALLLASIKADDKKKILRPICKDAVGGILLAYQDDPTFLTDAISPIPTDINTNNPLGQS
jgi:hypothetical protein